MPFRPNVNFQLSIGPKNYRFTEHPAAKGMPYGQTGRRATVYQVLDENAEKYALKVFTVAFRTPRIVEAATRLQAFAQTPGLGVCQRQVLTRETYPELIEKYPDLQFAVLMPWVQGETWQEFMVSHRSLPFDSAFTLAGQMTILLAGLEQNGLAHCDIAGPNVLVDFPSLGNSISTTASSLALVDVEEMYGPGLSKPEKLPAGTPGYDHKVARQGLWSAEADRFAGAVMLVEILTRHDERVRQISLQEQYFDPGEMQQNSDRYQAAIRTLKDNGVSLAADLFARAWFSQTLSECPSFSEWYVALNRPAGGMTPTQPYPVNWRPIMPGGGRPISNPPIVVSLEQVKPMLLQAAAEGRWQDILNIAPQILQSYPADKETLALQQRAQSLIQLDQAIENLWQVAALSGNVDDWDICLRSIVRAQYQARDVERYQQLRSEVEHEREIAAQTMVLAQLIAEMRWEDAEEMRSLLPLDHPKVAELFAQLDVAIGNQVRLTKLLKDARQAFGEQNWSVAIRLCREGLALDHEHSEFSSLLDTAQKARDKEQKREAELEQAIQRMDVRAVEATLSDIPQNHPLQTRGRTWLADFYKTESELNDAQRAFDPERVQRIFSRISAAFPRYAELTEWAQNALAAQQALLAARAQRDLPAVEKLLAELPAQHPAYQGTKLWLEEEKNRQQIVRQARADYDLDRLGDLLVGIPEDDPLFQADWQWLKAQQRMARDIQAALDQFDVEKLAELLAALPSSYPYREKLENWQRQELSLRAALRTAQEKYDLTEAQKLADTLPTGHPLHHSVDSWLSQSRQFALDLQQARQSGDYERALALLATVTPEYPDFEALSQWGKTSRARHQQAKILVAEHDPDGLENLLSDWPETDAHLTDLRNSLAGMRSKQQELARWQTEAENALLAGDFQQVAQLCQMALSEKAVSPRFKELAAIAQLRLENIRQAEEARNLAQAALAQNRYLDALNLAASCAELEPENAVYSHVADEMRENLLQLARAFEAKGKWDQAMKVWSTLKQTAPAKKDAFSTVTQLVEQEPQPASGAGLEKVYEFMRAGKVDQAVGQLKEIDRAKIDVNPAVDDLIHEIRRQIQGAEKAKQWERAKQLWALLKEL